MLDLTQAYTGCPSSSLQFLHLPRETLLLYPFADSVVVLNARTLAFVRALAFWEVYPSTRHLAQSVQCLAVENGMKLVVASLGHRVVAWSLSGTRNDYWRVHSSLLLPEDQQVTALNCVSGLLAVGTRSTLSVYTLILENDLPTWSMKWSFTVPPLSRVRFSPSLMYIATTSLYDNVVHIYLTTTGRKTQAIAHPRPVTDLVWRNSPCTTQHARYRDDPVLYTITTDATLRIFLPVLDAPQYLQLHSALDTFSSLPFSVASRETNSSIFRLDREVMNAALKSVLAQPQSAEEDGRRRRIREITDEGWDVFLRVLGDGSLVVQAIANIDRRPPTLLKQFTLLQTAPGALPGPPAHLYIVPNPGRASLTLVTSPPLKSYELAILPFFDARADGLRMIASGAEHADADAREDSRAEVVRFMRTPNGEGVGALRSDGSGEAWNFDWARTGRLVRTGRWPASSGAERVDHFVVLDAGILLTLHTSPPATLHVPLITSFFALSPPTHSSPQRTLIGVTASYTIVIISATISGATPSLSLLSESSLPLPAPPKMILPVDPMAWVGQFGTGTRGAAQAHDVLLSVSEDGELAFWVPEGGLGDPWKCTGIVRTGCKGLSMARCSSAKKSVLVVPTPDGAELTIWDSKESEFALGLEYRSLLSDAITDLDWAATPDGQSLLAVGFAHRVELLCQQRATYFDQTPGWGVCWKVDVGAMVPHPISDSIWLARGTLLVGAGHQLFMYGQRRGVEVEADAPKRQEESLFEHVARLNGPLDDYHPQMVLQCLLWEKIQLVKGIIVNLARNVESRRDVHEWENLPADKFLQRDDEARATNASHRPKYSLLFDIPERNDDDEDDPFNPTTVKKLIDRLEEQPLPHLTPSENASLLVLVQTALEIEEQRRALDSNGLRYLISMRSFYILNRRASEPTTPASPSTGSPAPPQLQRRERLRYRDMIWAFHSDSQEVLLATSMAACGGKMCWPDARALGVFTWMRSADAMRAHMEVVARNAYMAGDLRDPTACSLFYFALGKVKLVHGLWRQAAWHKEYQVMLKFLNNDFKEPRWRTAALKNAFALLSKRRFEYAAAFFLLGGSLKDAVNVCIKNMSDWQLAVALARVVEGGDDGPVLGDILNNTVIPLAFKNGNRYLASWAFWLLHRRDLAVRILVTPLQDMASTVDAPIVEIGDPHYDDPSLALLFSQLKSKTLQTAQGTSEISGRTEFNFVLQIARVFCRMGCHVLALDLVRSWFFQRPSTVVRDGRAARRPPSPVSTRFALEPALRHKSSILIDIDVTTAPPTRRASPSRSPSRGGSPPRVAKEELTLKDEGDLVARKAGIGSLMKSAKQDVKVPEFDMGAFF
ncbi:WD repeat-containing protein [Trametes versicolor FP-101664 SS1]|uniref:WD repeat-containing protein n=1 Tax=Trametes versicolor (strain FP-101664) TaxID=717944 RepID=UPI0004622E71|nr:WD repeat-containing protein [Trametes versicolor FP-101664 SS1]EIW64094.1 WD repeat-containing protein [Trametes versicolor FP-101664 SS1]